MEFYIRQKNSIVATGYFKDDNWLETGDKKFILKKDSQITELKERLKGIYTGHWKLMKEMIDKKIIVSGKLTKDYEFNTPSMAGLFVIGSESNGNSDFKDKDLKSINDYIRINKEKKIEGETTKMKEEKNDSEKIVEEEITETLIFSDNKIQNRKEDGSPYFKIITRNTPSSETLKGAYEAEDFDKILRDSAPAINLNHTSLKVAEKLCNALPDSFWNDPEIYKRRILNPFGDSGFLEKFIINRLVNNDAMIKQFPDYGERVYHILHNMIFSIAKTNAASYWLRKIVYYSADATKTGSNGDFPTIFNGKLFSIGGDKDKLESYKMTGNIKSPWVENEVGKNNIFNYPLLDWVNYEEEIIDKNGKKKKVKIKRDPLDYFAMVFWDVFTNEKFDEIEEERRKKIMDEIKKKLDGYFDVIIGNPPYNTNNPETGKVLNTVYQSFCLAANKLNPKYQSFIILSRWLDGVASGYEMSDFMDLVLNNEALTYLELIDGKEAFPSVDIKEVCIYTIGDKSDKICYNGNIVDRKDILRTNKDGKVLLNRAYDNTILRKIKSKCKDFLEKEVKTVDYKNGLIYDDYGDDILGAGVGFKFTNNKVILNGKECERPILDYSLKKDEKHTMKVYIPNVKLHRGDKPNFTKEEYAGFIFAEPSIVSDWCGNNFDHDVLMYNSIGHYYAGTLDWPWNIVTVKPGEIMVGAGTFAIGVDMSNEEVKNLKGYIQTKFTTYLIRQVQSSQHISSNIFALVPKLDFTKEWDDNRLNEYFELSDKEIKLINDDFNNCTVSIRKNLGDEVDEL